LIEKRPAKAEKRACPEKRKAKEWTNPHACGREGEKAKQKVSDQGLI
jgi:hypothetical protein